MTVPVRPGHRFGDLRKTAIGRAIPRETLVEDHHPLQPAVPLANEQRADFEADPIARRWPSHLEQAATRGPNAFAFRLAKMPQRRLVEIAKRRGLQSIR